MMSHGSCNDCAFFDDHVKASAQAQSADGLCRFNPPVTQPGPTEHGLWPVVSSNDWCGHFAGSSTAQVAAE